MHEVLVIGAGPSALAIATATAESGLQTAIIAPDPTEPWRPRFGAWADELEGLGLGQRCIAGQWPRTVAHSPRRRSLGRAYVSLDTAGLQAHLRAAAERAGVEELTGRVERVVHDSASSVLGLADGRRLPARLVIDAAGAGSPFVQRSGATRPSWQLAYGQLLRVRGGHPWPLDEMVLMDFRPPPGSGPSWRQLPTFLYAMPYDEEHVFVEETSLVHAAPPTMDQLRARLADRLAAMGVTGEVLEEEHCRILMTGPLPTPGQRTLAYGAAAGMVHPATGYQLARVLHTAPQLAAAVHQGLRESGPAAAAEAGWDLLWPSGRRRSWALYTFGAEVLAALDLPVTQAFFAAFFRLAPSLWEGFHSATLPPAGVARAMLSFFVRAPRRVRQRLIATTASSAGLDMVRGLVRG